MARMIASFKVAAPADEVWALVSWRGSANLAGYAYFKEVKYSEAGCQPGATRQLVIDGRPTITERLEFSDDENRRVGYRVLDAGDLPLADYSGVISVLPAGKDACYIAFEGDGIACGQSFEALNAFYQEAEADLCVAIQRKLGIRESA